jgi:hypothetical protein
MDYWWNDNDRENRSTVKPICQNATLSTTNPTLLGIRMSGKKVKDFYLKWKLPKTNDLTN